MRLSCVESCVLCVCVQCGKERSESPCEQDGVVRSDRAAEAVAAVRSVPAATVGMYYIHHERDPGVHSQSQFFDSASPRGPQSHGVRETYLVHT